MSRLRFLSPEEETALLNECKEPLRTIVLLGIYAGLRISAEALTPKKENVDLSRRLLTIEAAYSKSGDTQTLPLHSKLIGPLTERLEHAVGEYVFERPNGKSVVSIKSAFDNACQRAGLKGVTRMHCGTPSLLSSDVGSRKQDTERDSADGR